MERCRTCKYYVPLDEPDDQNAGCCEHPAMQDREGFAQTPHDGVMAYNSDTHEGASGLYVGPDFGCIHHEAKL